MPSEEIINYIRTELAKGRNRQKITDSLLRAGWPRNSVQEIFDTYFSPVSTTIGSPQPTGKVVTEKDYPVTILWVFKAPIIIAVMTIMAALLGYYSSYLVIILFIYLIINPLARANFHYSLNDKYFHIRQGIIAKKQRSLPYGVIQNILIKQDLFDRVFRLASLRIENASQAGGNKNTHWWNKKRGSRSSIYKGGLGSSGNGVNLLGLKKQDAEALKNVFLQKIKENPIEESGL